MTQPRKSGQPHKGWKDSARSNKFRYLIARNKITRLVDVIDAKSGRVVSRDHPNHDAAEATAAKLLAMPPAQLGGARE